MNTVFDLEKAFRILKSKKITKEKVAAITQVSPGYISKMLSGDKPITQNFIDVFLKEFGTEIAGVELTNQANRELAASIVALEARVDLLTRLSLGLVKSLNEMNRKHGRKPLSELINKDTAQLLKDFYALVEDKAHN